MTHLDLTLPSPAENLACDEALLEACETTGTEVLRFWEPAQSFVVVGYANRVEVEVDTAACAARGLAVYRRCSGGGAVLQGPGCLNYTLALRVPECGWLASIAGTNQFILHRHREALERLLGREVAVCGHTDLALDGRKFSGNAQRRHRRALLFHGTFLCGIDLELMGQVLRFPSKAPAYRQGRAHAKFLLNLDLNPTQLKAALCEAWQANQAGAGPPLELLRTLAQQKYSDDRWNWKL